VGILAATGCGEDDAPHRAERVTTTEAAAHAVSSARVDIVSFRFRPAHVTLRRGGRITWVNRDRAAHTAENEALTAGRSGAPARFGTGRLEPGAHKTLSFREPGTYRYYCVYHRFMTAVITVTQGSSA